MRVRCGDAGGGVPKGRPLTRRAFALGGAALAASAFAGWVAWGNAALVTTRIEVASARVPAAFDGFRVAHVSDLHNAEFGPGNADLLGLLRAVRPDLVAVTGDLVDSRRTDFDVAASFMEAAAGIAPSAYVAGNHEARLMRRDPEGYAAYERRLVEAGTAVLHGGAYAVDRAGARIAVLGADDPGMHAVADGSAGDVPTEADTMREELAGLMARTRSLGGAAAGEEAPFALLLSHRPELFDVYIEAGVDLALTGHAHGGQFRLPLVGGVVAPNQGFFPRYDAGLYTGTDGVRPAAMVVSRGLGNSLFPFRVNNRPEVVLVELRRTVSTPAATNGAGSMAGQLRYAAMTTGGMLEGERVLW